MFIKVHEPQNMHRTKNNNNRNGLLRSELDFRILINLFENLGIQQTVMCYVAKVVVLKYFTIFRLDSCRNNRVFSIFM